MKRLRNINNHGLVSKCRRPIRVNVNPVSVDSGNGYWTVAVRLVRSWWRGGWYYIFNTPRKNTNRSGRRRVCNYKRMMKRGIREC